MSLSPVNIISSHPAFFEQKTSPKRDKVSKLACFLFHTLGKSFHTLATMQKSPFFEMALRRGLKNETCIISNTKHLPEDWIRLYLANPPLETLSFQELLKLYYLNDLFLKPEVCKKILVHLRIQAEDHPYNIIRGFHFYFEAPKECLPIFERFLVEPTFLKQLFKIPAFGELKTLEKIVLNSPNYPFFILLAGWFQQAFRNNAVEAAKLYEKAAKNSCTAGFFYLANLHCTGKGLEKNLQKARLFAATGARLGCPLSLNLMGALCTGDHEIENAESTYRLAISKQSRSAKWNLAQLKKFDHEGMLLAKEAAEEGLCFAQYFIGLKYYFGEDGFVKDCEKGLSYIERAAGLEHPEALTFFALEFAKKHPDPKDLTKIQHLLAKAAQVDPAAKAILGVNLFQGGCGPIDQKLGMELIKEAALQNATHALNFLGKKAQTLSESRDFFEKSAALGDPEGLYLLGLSYLKETSTLQRGYLHVKEAAESGYCPAYAALAKCYFAGRGVLQNRGEAIMWTRKALASTKDVDGHMHLIMGFSLMLQGNPFDALPYLIEAIERDNPDAMIYLASLFELGNGVPHDVVRAKELYRMAAKKGSSFAKTRLRELGEENCLIQ